MATVRPLPADLAKVAEEELGEVPSRLHEDLEHLRNWMAKQPHLPQRSDQFLVAFLRSSKFSLERAKEKLDMYHTLRTAVPEFFSGPDPSLPELARVLRSGIYVVLPNVDKLGRRVILIRLSKVDPETIKMNDVMKIAMMMLDYQLMNDDHAVVKGLAFVSDMQGFTMAHFAQYTPAIIKKALAALQDGYPLRTKGFFYCNMPPFYETVTNFFRSFMNDKFKKRIFFYHSNEQLCEAISKDALPDEYGGTAGPLDSIFDSWVKMMDGSRDFFLENEKLRADESRRPGKSKTYEDLFGMEGSFRQIKLD